MRRLSALALILLLTACTSATKRDVEEKDSGFNANLAKLAGRSEPQLIAAMGRAPDSVYQADPQTRILKWRNGVPAAATPPQYTSMGGTWVPAEDPKAARTRPGCVIDWTVVGGVALTYQSRGANCAS